GPATPAAVAVASVTDAVAVGVGLIRVGRVGTVVGRIGNAVAVAVGQCSQRLRSTIGSAAHHGDPGERASGREDPSKLFPHRETPCGVAKMLRRTCGTSFNVALYGNLRPRDRE